MDTTARVVRATELRGDCGDELVLLDDLTTDLCGAAAVIVRELRLRLRDQLRVDHTFTAIDLWHTTVGTQTITVTDTSA